MGEVSHFCLLIRRPIILHGGAIMLNTTGEECAPDICLFNHIYSDSVFLLTPDGLNLTLFCVRANMRRLWKM